jgi:sugar phosphate isomerase/epimerase
MGGSRSTARWVARQDIVMDLTRRRLLTDSALVGAASAVSSAGMHGAFAAARKDAPGIQLYTVSESLRSDVAGTLRNVRSIGFKEVETAGFAGMSAAEFRMLLDDANLAAPSAHLPLDESNLDAAFADAHALGARYVVSSVLRPGTGPLLYAAPAADAATQGTPPPPAAMTLDDAKRTAELANRIGERAKRAGLQYAYHNHQFELVPQEGGAVPFEELLKQTDPELVKFEMDCGWMVVGGRNPTEYFERHPGRFPLIHVKDFLPLPAGRDPWAPRSGAELGRGTIDYAPIFAAASANGLEHFFAEQEGPYSRMSQLEAAAVAYDYLRRTNA